MASEHAERVIGVRFTRAGAASFYNPGDTLVEMGDMVVVDTTGGPDLGEVVVAPGPLVHRDPMVVVRPMTRVADSEDIERRAQMKIKEAEAFVLARAKVRNLGLMMKITSARIGLDDRKVVLEFTANERVELRALYGKLSDALKRKIELKSVGPRDEAKSIGALGRCGLAVCCTSWLSKFESVSIKMAKEQALPISAEGLAGQCGRLKCCLRFEYEQYRAANKLLPRVGERVMTPDGPAKVIVGHPLKETVSVIPERKSPDEWVHTVELSIADIQRLPRDDNPRRN